MAAVEMCAAISYPVTHIQTKTAHILPTAIAHLECREFSSSRCNGITSYINSIIRNFLKLGLIATHRLYGGLK
jgi:hypothetical protein